MINFFELFSFGEEKMKKRIERKIKVPTDISLRYSSAMPFTLVSD